MKVNIVVISSKYCCVFCAVTCATEPAQQHGTNDEQVSFLYINCFMFVPCNVLGFGG